MVRVAEVHVSPGNSVTNAELPTQRTDHWDNRRQLDHAFEKGADTNVHLHHNPVAADLLYHQLFDSADFASVNIEKSATDKRFDMNFARCRVVRIHDHGMCLTIFSRSHFSNAMIGVLLTTRSTRRDGPWKPIREKGMRIGVPRPLPR